MVIYKMHCPALFRGQSIVHFIVPYESFFRKETRHIHAFSLRLFSLFFQMRLETARNAQFTKYQALLKTFSFSHFRYKNQILRSASTLLEDKDWEGLR